MTTHIEIVSVTYCRGKKGERVPALTSDEFAINRPDPDDTWPDNLPLYNWNGDQVDTWPPATHHEGQNAYLDLPEDWYGLRFEFIGQFFEGQQSGLSWESSEGCAGEVFEDWADDLRAIADKLLDAEYQRLCEATRSAYGIWEQSYPEEPHEVRFLTAWEYRFGKDYEGECWSEWDLLGLIDLSKIETLIIPAQAQEVSCQPQ